MARVMERLTAREIMNSALTEKQFQQWIIEVAQIHKWAVFHPYDSRRSNPGWPDLVLIKAPTLIFAELKSTAGALKAAQKWWLENLAHVAAANTTVSVHVWRPENSDEIVEVLSR